MSQPRSLLGRIAAIPLADQVVGAVLGGAGLLLVEIRFEHREALGETWRAWVPLGYLALLLVGGTAALLRGGPGGRRALEVLFGLGFLIGALGVWFHSGGHPVEAIGHIVDAWLAPPGSNAGIEVGSTPPLLAPAAFAGIGLIGFIASRARN